MPETEPQGKFPTPLIAYSPSNKKRLSSAHSTTVVCELRFPLMLELGEESPPAIFVKALRKQYPQMEHLSEISVGPGGAMPGAGAHQFRSLRGGWTVTLKQNAVSLETKAYPGYEKFRERVLEILDAAAPVIDSDFWTRLGLRYINLVPVNSDSAIATVVNPALSATLDSGVFRRVVDYSGVIRGGDDQEGFLLQHGLKREGSTKGTVEVSYLVDVDVWRAEVELGETPSVLDELHDRSLAVFDWSLSAAAVSGV